MQMNQRKRWGFTSAETTELLDRWQRGESWNAIGRAFGKTSSSIYGHLAPRGEIFYALKEAQAIIEHWRNHYNFARPHGAHQGRTPYESLREKLT